VRDASLRRDCDAVALGVGEKARDALALRRADQRPAVAIGQRGRCDQRAKRSRRRASSGS
jgi:hypothetical protein